ncbi:MAG: recombinase, partial [Bacteroidia bacterium]
DHKIRQSNFLVRVIQYHAGKNRIKPYIGQTTHLVAYQATQHTGTTGEKYITTTREEYANMFWSAGGAGLVIGVLCLFKLFLAGMDTSPFGHAFWYSLNYAFGFILIYFLHFTVATKQPAMTAASLAKVLESSGKEDYEGFAALFARLFRSQFIAFCGNVFFSFPTALMVVLIGNFIFGENLVSPADSEKLLKDIDPTRSSAFYHAAIAGFHLFFAGLLSGYVVNKSIYQQVSFRFQRHPVLVSFISKERLQKMAAWYDKHLGGLTSNFWLGVLLGCTGTIGYFFGMDWDIRHITFSSGNLALGLVGREFAVSSSEIMVAVFCIGGIGFFNFWVSFLLSMFVAMRAREISLFQVFKISGAIFQRFKHTPLEFFFPPEESKE